MCILIQVRTFQHWRATIPQTTSIVRLILSGVVRIFIRSTCFFIVTFIQTQVEGWWPPFSMGTTEKWEKPVHCRHWLPRWPFYTRKTNNHATITPQSRHNHAHNHDLKRKEMLQDWRSWLRDCIFLNRKFFFYLKNTQSRNHDFWFDDKNLTFPWVWASFGRVIVGVIVGVIVAWLWRDCWVYW